MFRSTSTFDRALDKATSETLLDPDWESTLQICDSIRSGETLPKYAVNAIKKRLYHQNPHVCLYALHVLESCVKNCGSSFHVEIATKPFMEDLREMARLASNDTLRNKILELIQVWAHAFRNEPSCKAVLDTLNQMKSEGFKFPYLRESDAMFTADSAPAWAEGDNCHRCRVKFGLVIRQHHCRCCGQVFCDKCSSKTSPIPKFGIEKEVRVCDDCFEKINKTTPILPKGGSDESTVKTSSSKREAAPKATAPAGKTDQELREEEELQMAIALSQSEAEAKEQSKRRSSSMSSSMSSAGVGASTASKPTSSLRNSTNGIMKTREPKEDDPELTRYLDREYWEQKQWEQQQQQQKRRSSSPAPSAPSQVPAASKLSLPSTTTTQVLSQELEHSPVDDKVQEMEGFVNSLGKTLEMFINRMNSNKVRGRPIANDSSVQSLFLNITNMHSNLIKYMQDEEDKRVHFEGLQDKLSEIRDARAALDSLREEHREQKRREAEELEAIRQQQMAHKLDIMRKQKQEYLQYQRQVAYQRLQDQEREMQMRKEQLKYGVQPPPPVQSQWQTAYPPPPAGYGPYHGPQVQGQQMPQQGYIPPGHALPQGHYMPPEGGFGHPQPPPPPTVYAQIVAPGPTTPVHQMTAPPTTAYPVAQPPQPQSGPPSQPEEPLITFD